MIVGFDIKNFLIKIINISKIIEIYKTILLCRGILHNLTMVFYEHKNI